MGNGGKKIRLSFNSPVILGFTLACFIVLILDKVTGSASTRAFFSVYRSSLASPFTYIRFFRTCVRTCQLGSFLWKYYDVTGCRTAFGRKIRFGKYSLCDFSDSAGNGCDQFHIFPTCPAPWGKRCCICVYIAGIIYEY